MLELAVSFASGGFVGVFITAICAGGARKDESVRTVLSDADQRRLAKEWTDANMRSDDEARRRAEDKILGGAALGHETDP